MSILKPSKYKTLFEKEGSSAIEMADYSKGMGRFGISKDVLKMIVTKSICNHPEELFSLCNKYKGTDGFAKVLDTSDTMGLRADKGDFSEREMFFGNNSKPVNEMKTFWELVKEALEDFILRVHESYFLGLIAYPRF